MSRLTCWRSKHFQHPSSSSEPVSPAPSVPTFCEPHGADGRVAENDRGDVLVVQPGVLLALEEPVGQLPASCNGHCTEGQGA